ncbi:MAG: hypothetical protein JW786_04700 [Desulfobacterales bacterium]|nr:hypothetical protein [Desulfobacterales bacterium]
MHNISKPSMIFLLVAALVFVPFSTVAMANEINSKNEMAAEKMAVDILLVRPFGIVATAVGTVLFIVSLPFSALGGNTHKVWQKMVAEPAQYTFKRPVGDL